MFSCLLVAGDKAARDIVKIGLEQTASFQIDTAEDAWALEMARVKPYQVAIVDSTLADGTDGVQLIGRLRDELPSAQLLLISRTKGEARYLTRDRQHLGIFAYIHIPVEPLDFFRTVGRLSSRLSGSESQ